MSTMRKKGGGGALAEAGDGDSISLLNGDHHDAADAPSVHQFLRSNSNIPTSFAKKSGATTKKKKKAAATAGGKPLLPPMAGASPASPAALAAPSPRRGAPSDPSVSFVGSGVADISPRQQLAQEQQAFLQRLSAEEARLADLQRLATAQLQQRPLALLTPSPHLLKPLTGTSQPAASRAASLTGTEAEFLSRQGTAAPAAASVAFADAPPRLQSQDDAAAAAAAAAAASSSSAAPSPSRASSASALLQTAPPPAATQAKHAQVAAALKRQGFEERLQAVVEENQRLAGLVAAKEDELERKDRRLRALALDCDRLRNEALTEARRLQREHELELVRLKEAHAQEKALLLSTPPAPADASRVATAAAKGAASSSSSSSQPPPSRAASTAASVAEGDELQRALAQSESLRDEVLRLTAQLAAQRAALQRDFAAQQQRALCDWQAETRRLQAALSALEDEKQDWADAQRKVRVALCRGCVALCRGVSLTRCVSRRCRKRSCRRRRRSGRPRRRGAKRKRRRSSCGATCSTCSRRCRRPTASRPTVRPLRVPRVPLCR